jgi:hypothetical protein
MLHCVDLRDVEVSANLLLDENVLVHMKTVPRIFKFLKGLICVSFKVSVIYKIEDSTSCLNNFCVRCTSDNPQKYLLHIFVLISCPLGDEGDPLLEVMKGGVSCHRLETAVNLTLSTGEQVRGPFHQVVLKDALVKLVENVGRERGEDVAEGENRPKWIDGP